MIFGTSRAISRKNSEVEGRDTLIVDLADVVHLGVSAALALEESILDMVRAKRTVYISGARKQALTRFKNMGLLDQLPEENLKTTREEALTAACLRHSESCSV